jgi:hypothetical protein
MLQAETVFDNIHYSHALYRIISFAMNCGLPSVTSGISIPLLSVCLATLMALFRDNDFAKNVSQDDLTLLIREAGTALLDSRLTTAEMDEATSTQMVRAMNKVSPTCQSLQYHLILANNAYSLPYKLRQAHQDTQPCIL